MIIFKVDCLRTLLNNTKEKNTFYYFKHYFFLSHIQITNQMRFLNFNQELNCC